MGNALGREIRAGSFKRLIDQALLFRLLVAPATKKACPTRFRAELEKANDKARPPATAPAVDKPKFSSRRKWHVCLSNLALTARRERDSAKKEDVLQLRRRIVDQRPEPATPASTTRSAEAKLETKPKTKDELSKSEINLAASYAVDLAYQSSSVVSGDSIAALARERSQEGPAPCPLRLLGLRR